LALETPEGARIPSPQAHLTSLISDQILDPMEILNLKPKEQGIRIRELVQSLIPGIDFGKIESQNETDYERRTEVNRLAKQARAAADMINVPAGTPNDPIDEQELVRSLQKAGETNADIERRKGNRRKALEDVERDRATVARVDAAVTAITSEIEATRTRDVTRMEEQIRALQMQIRETNERSAQKTESETQRLRTEATEASARADSLQAQLDKAGPLPAIVDTAALSRQIDEARQTNAAIARAVQRTQHRLTAEKYEQESIDLTEAMRARDAAKREAIANADLPIEGFEVTAEEIRLNGQLFSQASTAQRYRTVFALALAKHPKVRLFWIRDGAALDDDNLRIVEELAEEFDCYVLLESVRPLSGKAAIVLQNGRVIEEMAEQREAVPA
jgi:hypothetical protein